MAFPWVALRININKKCHIIRFLNEYQNICIRYYFVTSCLNAKYPRNIHEPYLKSSKPLADADVSNKPKKPRSYAVFEEFTVDEETFEKIRKEEETDDDFDGTDLNDVLLHSDHYYDIHKLEEKDFKRKNRRKALDRKMFPTLVEKPLMTWAAREQVRYLNRTDADEWTPQKIAQHFPISEIGAKKLVRSLFTFSSENKVKEYDMSVQKNWAALKKGEYGSFHESLHERWCNKQLHPNQAYPNLAFPVPPPTNTNPSPLLLDDPKKPVGEFYSIVKPYVDIKKQELKLLKQNETKGDTKHTGDSNLTTWNPEQLEQESDWMRTETSLTVSDDLNEIDDRLYRSRMRRETHVTRDQFELNMKEKLENKYLKTEDDVKMLDWLKNRTFLERPKVDDSQTAQQSREVRNTIEQPIQKYKHEVKVTYDTPKNEKYKEAYVYSHQVGYQHPLGKSDINEQKLRNEKRVKIENNLYKVGDSFYSEDGEFLYKVF